MCPVECCLPNPEHREEEPELAQKAIQLHPDDGDLKGRIASGDYPSRFRK